MAKAKTQTRTMMYAAPRPAPIVVNVPRPQALSVPKGKKAPTRRRHKHGGAKSNLMEAVVAGAALGYLDKNGTNIPTVPVLGRAGTLAVLCYFFRDKSPWIAGAVGPLAGIAAYEMITKGSISGDVASQGGGVIGGVAAQM